MTDKEPIIVHGVDVSKCDKLNLASAYGWDDPAMCSISCCKNGPNCLFKQLARKTQECEEKDKQIKEWNKYVNLVHSWITQAAKDLGLDTEHSFGTEHFTFAVRCLKEEHEKLKQECEELKDKLKIYEKMFDNPEFRVALTDIRTGERDIRKQRDKRLTKENTHYRKALEEIEEFCTHYLMHNPQSESIDLNIILNIVNKAKGGDDE